MSWSLLRVLAPPVFVAVLVSLGGSAANAAPLSADMIVSVPDQALAVVDRGKLIARYSSRPQNSEPAILMPATARRSALCLFQQR